MATHSAKIGSALVTLAFLAAAWWLLAPTQIGGRTSYAIVVGNSMEPSLEKGDFAVTRARASYGPGDVVLYHDAPTGKRFLHRIVRVHGDRLVTKGDNNSFIDPSRPALGDVQGELAITLPGVGSAIAWLVQPLHLAILFFLLTFAVLAGGREVSRRRQPYAVRPIRAEPQARAGPTIAVARPLFAGALAATVVFGLLAVLAWRGPVTVEHTVAGAYAHTGSIAYEGRVPRDAVYPDGRVVTGETAFTRLVPALDVSFDYAFETDDRADVRGAIALDAVVSDGQGWERTLPLAVSAPFSGRTARVEGRLVTRRLELLAAQVRDLTGVGASTFRVELRPRVAVSGYSGSSVIDDSFAPALPLIYDGSSLRFDPSDGEVEAVRTSRVDGETTTRIPGRLALGPAGLPVAEARTIAMLGLLVSLTLLGLSAFLLARGLAGTERERIAVRFGSRMVSARAVVPDGRWVTEVDSIDELVRIAAHYDRVILHSTEDSEDVYVADDGVTVYLFRAPREQIAPTAVNRFASP